MNPKKDGASARPWHVGYGGDTIPRIYGRSPHNPVCQFGSGIDECLSLLRNHEANAALIIQAVNERSALLAVAEAASECSQWNDGRPINAPKAFEKLDNALAKLRGVQK